MHNARSGVVVFLLIALLALLAWQTATHFAYSWIGPGEPPDAMQVTRDWRRCHFEAPDGMDKCMEAAGWSRWRSHD